MTKKIGYNAVPIVCPRSLPGDKFHGVFHDEETGASALWVILYSSKTSGGGWKPFAEKEIEDFYIKESGCAGFSLNHLIIDGFVVLGDDNKYRVTDEFNSQCFAAAFADFDSYS